MHPSQQAARTSTGGGGGSGSGNGNSSDSLPWDFDLNNSCDDLASIRPPSALFKKFLKKSHDSLSRATEKESPGSVGSIESRASRIRLRRMPSLESLESMGSRRGLRIHAQEVSPLDEEMPPVSPFFTRISEHEITKARAVVRRASTSRRNTVTMHSDYGQSLHQRLQQRGTWCSPDIDTMFEPLRLDLHMPGRMPPAVGPLDRWTALSPTMSSWGPLDALTKRADDMVGSLESAEWLGNQEPPMSPIFAAYRSPPRPRKERRFLVNIHSLFSSPLGDKAQPQLIVREFPEGGEAVDIGDPDVRQALRHHPWVLKLGGSQRKDTPAATRLRLPTRRPPVAARGLGVPTVSFVASNKSSFVYSDRGVRAIDIDAMVKAYLPSVHQLLTGEDPEDASLSESCTATVSSTPAYAESVQSAHSGSSDDTLRLISAISLPSTRLTEPSPNTPSRRSGIGMRPDLAKLFEEPASSNARLEEPPIKRLVRRSDIGMRPTLLRSPEDAQQQRGVSAMDPPAPNSRLVEPPLRILARRSDTGMRPDPLRISEGPQQQLHHPRATTAMDPLTPNRRLGEPSFNRLSRRSDIGARLDPPRLSEDGQRPPNTSINPPTARLAEPQQRKLGRHSDAGIRTEPLRQLRASASVVNLRGAFTNQAPNKRNSIPAPSPRVSAPLLRRRSEVLPPVSTPLLLRRRSAFEPESSSGGGVPLHSLRSPRAFGSMDDGRPLRAGALSPRTSALRMSAASEPGHGLRMSALPNANISPPTRIPPSRPEPTRPSGEFLRNTMVSPRSPSRMPSQLPTPTKTRNPATRPPLPVLVYERRLVDPSGAAQRLSAQRSLSMNGYNPLGCGPRSAPPVHGYLGVDVPVLSKRPLGTRRLDVRSAFLAQEAAVGQLTMRPFIKETDYVEIVNHLLVISGKTNDIYKLHYNAYGEWKICNPLESIGRHWSFPLMFKVPEGTDMDSKSLSAQDIKALKVIKEAKRKLEEKAKKRAEFIAKRKLSNQVKKRIKKLRQPIQLTPDIIEAYQ
ncbi:hypothetical protein LPJ66_001494 [Kickxella alabastrina]|uniref:Uncharacterized protein n=1 Tax=Kickxella alabastrina TaxID=61397 RepID=A0ACC1IT51_9FUNG|nr:hypothetical protein LPJ66_001494 [Kickxella alabastrina]